MVLVDTSVWVRFFGGKEPFLSEAARLLRGGQAAAHELVYGELLMGDLGTRQQFLRDYERMPQAKRIAHHEVVAIVRGRRLHGRGVRWTDAHLLASALAGRMQLWTVDPRLAAMAEELGVDHKV